MQNSAETENKDEIIKEMLENGVQYGRAKRFTNPKLRDYLLKSNKTVEIFDAAQTLDCLDKIADFLEQLLAEKKTILFVGVQPAASESIKKIAMALEQPYLIFKWVGGFLTNFTTIKARIQFFEQLKEKKESGEIDSYPPVEKHRILRELQKMENLYSGAINMAKLPDAIFTANLEYKPHRTMQREAKRIGIPIIGICGSDNDPDKFKIFAAANDKAPRSINWIIDYLLKKLKPMPLEIAGNEVNSGTIQNEQNNNEQNNTEQEINVSAEAANLVSDVKSNKSPATFIASPAVSLTEEPSIAEEKNG
jgi:small subunit ribosomal protein S2